MAKKPEPVKPSQVEDLEWLRDQIRETWANASDPFARSQLAAQYRGVVNDLAALAPVEKGLSLRDELKLKREERGATATAHASAGRVGKPRTG